MMTDYLAYSLLSIAGRILMAYYIIN